MVPGHEPAVLHRRDRPSSPFPPPSRRAASSPGSARLASFPSLLGLSGALFLAEWALLGWQPRAASVLLYLHSSVLGAIAISAFWSLLNERFDPHSAKPLLAQVAAAATFGGLVGGVGAERSGGAASPGRAAPPAGHGRRRLPRPAPSFVGRGCRRGVARPAEPEDARSGWAEIRRVPLLRDLALVVALAAMLAALVDYVLKAEAVAYFGKGEPLRALLRPLLRRDRPRRIPAPGRRWAASPWRRLGLAGLRGQPSRRGGRGQPPELRRSGALARHPPARPRRGACGTPSSARATSCSTPRCRKRPSAPPSRSSTWPGTASARRGAPRLILLLTRLGAALLPGRGERRERARRREPSSSSRAGCVRDT